MRDEKYLIDISPSPDQVSLPKLHPKPASLTPEKTNFESSLQRLLPKPVGLTSEATFKT